MEVRQEIDKRDLFFRSVSQDFFFGEKLLTLTTTENLSLDELAERIKRKFPIYKAQETEWHRDIYQEDDQVNRVNNWMEQLSLLDLTNYCEEATMDWVACMHTIDPKLRGTDRYLDFQRHACHWSRLAAATQLAQGML